MSRARHDALVAELKASIREAKGRNRKTETDPAALADAIRADRLRAQHRADRMRADARAQAEADDLALDWAVYSLGNNRRRWWATRDGR